jgi:hypothetical protein
VIVNGVFPSRRDPQRSGHITFRHIASSACPTPELKFRAQRKMAGLTPLDPNSKPGLDPIATEIRSPPG